MEKTRRIFMAYFENERDILDATVSTRKSGLSIIDVYTPYAVHGMDKAMGLKASNLPWVCFVLGLLGAALKVYFEFWTTAVDWPINIGGKPWNSLPAFVPVTFEVMVLCAGVSTVIAFFIAARMFPGKSPEPLYDGATDDRFVLVLEEVDSGFDPEQIQAILQSFNAVKFEERVV